MPKPKKPNPFADLCDAAEAVGKHIRLPKVGKALIIELWSPDNMREHMERVSDAETVAVAARRTHRKLRAKKLI